MRIREPVSIRWALALCLALWMGLGIVACQAPPDEGEASGADAVESTVDETAIIEAHKALIRSYETADYQAFVALLAPGPELLIFHPYLENRFDGLEQAEQRLGVMFERLGEATWTEVHPAILVEGDIGWVTSHVLLNSPNMDRPFVGRGTEIWRRYEEGWRLVHAHWSEHP
jgi:ketosteroid isomerase-like protein